MVLFLKLSKLILINVKFNCVITGSDRLHIKVNELVGLNCFQIVKIDYSEEVNEYAESTSHKSKDSPPTRLSLIDNTRSLNIKYTIISTPVFCCSRRISIYIGKKYFT